ncbi:hypothetical protein C8Q80DRAFT_216620 [Daedaleopsis nitida]|nr:hypothetical protein C8Q80DRAFT_216620 [Daedaleopsis nitida]
MANRSINHRNTRLYDPSKSRTLQLLNRSAKEDPDGTSISEDPGAHILRHAPDDTTLERNVTRTSTPSPGWPSSLSETFSLTRAREVDPVQTAPGTPYNSSAEVQLCDAKFPIREQEDRSNVESRAPSSEGYSTTEHSTCNNPGSSTDGAGKRGPVNIEQESEMDDFTENRAATPSRDSDSTLSDDSMSTLDSEDDSRVFAVFMVEPSTDEDGEDGPIHVEQEAEMDDFTESRAATPSGHSDSTLSDDTMSTLDSEDDSRVFAVSIVEVGVPEEGESPDTDVEARLPRSLSLATSSSTSPQHPHQWQIDNLQCCSTSDEAEAGDTVTGPISTLHVQSEDVQEFAAFHFPNDELYSRYNSGNDHGDADHGLMTGDVLRDPIIDGDCVTDSVPAPTISSSLADTTIPFLVDIPGYYDPFAVGQLASAPHYGMCDGPEPLHCDTAAGSNPVPVPTAQTDGITRGRVELYTAIVSAVESTKQHILGGVPCPAEIQVAVDTELLGLIEKICGLIRRF